MRAIIKFTKEDNIKYISHLDVLRMFQRAIKRAELPVSYSLGFNPHMLVGFACALPTGALSLAEYAEMKFNENISPNTIKERLNSVMPLGCRILDVVQIEESYPSLMAVVSAADYKIDIMQKSAYNLISELVDEANLKNEIIVNKKSKKGIKPTNIRPMIKELFFKDGSICCKLNAGNNSNLRPDTLMEYFSDKFDYFPDYVITRTELYVTENEQEINAMNAGGNF